MPERKRKLKPPALAYPPGWEKIQCSRCRKFGCTVVSVSPSGTSTYWCDTPCWLVDKRLADGELRAPG